MCGTLGAAICTFCDRKRATHIIGENDMIQFFSKNWKQRLRFSPLATAEIPMPMREL
jgi:hypothetical protein